MSKRSIRRSRSLLAVIVLISMSLACRQIGSYQEQNPPGPMEELTTSRGNISEEEAVQLFADREEERVYEVVENHNTAWVSACDTAGPAGPLSLGYLPGDEPQDDIITITDQEGVRAYSATQDLARLSDIYCREFESPALLECIEIRAWGFELVIYDSLDAETGPVRDENRVCYAASYQTGGGAAEADQDNAAIEATKAAAAEATLAAEAEATRVAADATATAVAVEATREAAEENPVPYFVSADCDCSGVDAPLDSSWIKIPGPFVSASGQEYENVQSLDCRWIEEYSSQQGDDRVEGQIWLVLYLFKLNSEQDAQALFAEFRDGVINEQPDCEKYGDCTVAIAEDEAERAFFVITSISFLDGAQVPSSHHASMTRRIITEGGGAFVLRLYVTHPELDTGSTWAIDMSRTLESCALELANR